MRPGLQPGAWVRARGAGSHRGLQRESRGLLAGGQSLPGHKSVIGKRSLWSHPRVRRGTSS